MGHITIKDIARLSGVSISSVSRALNDQPGVAPEIRKKVLSIAQAKGYRRNSLARSLSGQKSGLLGCIISDLDNPLFADTFLVLEQMASRRNYHVMLCHGRIEDPEIPNLLDFLTGQHVDGILAVTSCRRAPEVLRDYAQRVPFLVQGTLDCPEEGLPFSMVCVDNAAGGRMAAEYLFRMGHRNVVYLGLREASASHALRCRSFTERAHQLGMTVTVLRNEAASSTIEIGWKLAKQFFLDPVPATAIFASCDVLALGVIAAAHEFDLSIPEDISLLSFDNIGYAALPHIRLTTLDPQKEVLAAAAIDSLLSRIEHPGLPVQPPILIPPILVERSSCRDLHSSR